MDRPPRAAGLTTYLVERYWPGVDVAALRATMPRLEAMARAMTDEGTSVEHIGSILMPVDQVVFALFTASDAAVVRRLNERADLPVDRIATAIAFLADRPETEERTHR